MKKENIIYYTLIESKDTMSQDISALKFRKATKDSSNTVRYRNISIDCSKGKTDLFTDKQKYSLLKDKIPFIITYSDRVYCVFNQEGKAPAAVVRQCLDIFNEFYGENGTVKSLLDYYGIKFNVKKYQRKEE